MDIEVLRSAVQEARGLSILDRCRYYHNLNIALTTQNDKNNLMIIAAQSIRNLDDLYLLSLAIRWGANPNLYIRVANEQYERHFLNFLLFEMGNNRSLMDFSDSEYTTFLIFIVMMLVNISPVPVNLDLPLLQLTSELDIQDRLLRASEMLTNLVVNVNDTLDVFLMQTFGYNQPLDKDTISTLMFNLDLSQKLTLSVLIDQNIFDLGIDKLFESSLEYLLLANAINIFRSLPIQYRIRGKFEYCDLTFYYIIRAANYGFFMNMLELGFLTTYFEINYIIQCINRYPDDQDYYYQFLLLAVSVGNNLELDQIRSVPQRYEANIAKAFEKPYIQKVKTAPNGIVPHRLEKFAFIFGLSLEKTKYEMIQSLNEIYNANLDAIIKGFIDRYQTRLASVFMSFLEFNKPDIPAIQLERKDALKDPRLVNDHQTIVIEGSDGLYYPFNSDQFRKLLNNEFFYLNNGSEMTIPPLTRLEIEKRLELMKIYRILPDEVLTVKDGHFKLKENDLLSNAKSEAIKKSTLNYLLGEGVSLLIFDKIFNIENGNNIDFEDDRVQQLISSLMDNYEDYYEDLNPLYNLEKEHQIATLFRMLDYCISNSPEKINLFVELLKQ